MWIEKCTQIEEIDASAAILILQILLWMENCDKDRGEILNDICLELSEKLGMIHKVCLHMYANIFMYNFFFFFFFFLMHALLL